MEAVCSRLDHHWLRQFVADLHLRHQLLLACYVRRDLQSAESLEVHKFIVKFKEMCSIPRRLGSDNLPR